MDNNRALVLIEKPELTDQDRRFLKTHIEVYGDAIQSLELEIMALKDTVEYGQFLDNKLLTAKEVIINLASSGEKEQIKANLELILEHLQKS